MLFRGWGDTTTTKTALSIQYGRKAVVRNAAGGQIQGWYFLIANLMDGETINPDEDGNYEGNFSGRNTDAFE